MARMNQRTQVVRQKKDHVSNWEGAPSSPLTLFGELRRAVLSCLLWEDQFYENGISIAERISTLARKVDPDSAAILAVEARNKHNLRHAPLLLALNLIWRNSNRDDRTVLPLSGVIASIVKRPDEITELIAMYLKAGGKKCLPKAMKKGLGVAFNSFDAYQLAKYNRPYEVKLRDALRLVHPVPRDEETSEVFRKLLNDCLPAPDTWEVSLSAGADKNETWTRLLRENKLGGMALLRNLRNMTNAGVDRDLVVNAIRRMKVDKILPFRFIAAAQSAPGFEPEIENAFLGRTRMVEGLPGKTVILVDVSGSMAQVMSSKSKMRRWDAAYGLAMILRELCEDVEIFSFSDKVVQVPARHGFALRDALNASQSHSCTYLGAAVRNVDRGGRLIVLTDEQSHDAVPSPKGRGYIINLSSYDRGIKHGSWVKIDGFSEATIEFIREYEKELSLPS